VRLVREVAQGAEIALVENMSGMVCPACGHEHQAFPGDGVRRLAELSELPVWAHIPFDPSLGRETDLGSPGSASDPERPAARAFRDLAERVAEFRIRPREASP
jgi:hypothetical protein